MPSDPFYKLSILPDGLLGLIRKKTLEKGQFKLNLTLDKRSGKWVSEAEWKPIHGLEADTPWELLIVIASLIAPKGSIELTPKDKPTPQLDPPE